MLRTPRILTSLAAALALAALLAPTAAHADLHVGLGLGGALPWDPDNDTGLSVAGSITGGGFGDRLRIGGEFEFRDTETEILSVSGVDTRTYDIRAIVQFVPFPNYLSPYVGLGIGLQIIHLDDDRIENFATANGASIGAVGLGTGAVAMVGLNVPLTSDVDLFVEGRTDISVELTDNFEDALQPKDLSTFTGMLGLRLNF